MMYSVLRIFDCTLDFDDILSSHQSSLIISIIISCAHRRLP